jgi:hypothetical protein
MKVRECVCVGVGERESVCMLYRAVFTIEMLCSLKRGCVHYIDCCVRYIETVCTIERLCSPKRVCVSFIEAVFAIHVERLCSL